METEPKRAAFEWEFGEELVSLQVNSYLSGGGLYIGMVSYGEYGPEPFADMTVNIPGYPLAANEAFINGDLSRDIQNFIKENRLGKILPYKVRSGYGEYTAVAFDLERLQEFDLEGVARYKDSHHLSDKPAPKKERNRGDAR